MNRIGGARHCLQPKAQLRSRLAGVRLTVARNSNIFIDRMDFFKSSLGLTLGDADAKFGRVDKGFGTLSSNSSGGSCEGSLSPWKNHKKTHFKLITL